MSVFLDKCALTTCETLTLRFMVSTSPKSVLRSKSQNDQISKKGIRIMSLFEASSFEKYKELATSEPITVDLTADQQAVILKTHDYGLNALTEIEERLLLGIMFTLKNEIHP